LPIFSDAAKDGLRYGGPLHNDTPYDDSTFKFSAGVARDGCALWQNAGMVATALPLIFVIDLENHKNELDIL
jgi:hypothetical protein